MTNLESLLAGQPLSAEFLAGKRLTYLAVPYSDIDPDVRAARFQMANIAAASLMRNGHKVFSPISHTHPIAQAGNLPRGWDYWQAYDRIFLEMSGLVVVLQIDGWEASKGVAGEVEIARRLAIPVVDCQPGQLSSLALSPCVVAQQQGAR